MSFVVEKLSKTRFFELDLSSLGLSEKEIPAQNWECAVKVSEDYGEIIFTQLLSSSGEMRDGIYYYLITFGNDPILIFWNSGTASIVNKGKASEYPVDFLKQNINEAATVLTYEKAAFNWKV